MHKRGTLLALLVTGAVAFFAYLIIEPWIAASRMIWPPIPHPEQVLADAATLTAVYTNQSTIPESAWPKSIKEFQPRHLLKANGYLLAVISTGGINPGWGYAIYADGRTNSPTSGYQPDAIAVHPGIFRVRHIE